MTVSGLPWPSLLAAETEVTANPVHIHLAQSCYSGYIQSTKIVELCNQLFVHPAGGL